MLLSVSGILQDVHQQEENSCSVHCTKEGCAKRVICNFSDIVLREKREFIISLRADSGDEMIADCNWVRSGKFDCDPATGYTCDPQLSIGMMDSLMTSESILSVLSTGPNQNKRSTDESEDRCQEGEKGHKGTCVEGLAYNPAVKDFENKFLMPETADSTKADTLKETDGPPQFTDVAPKLIDHDLTDHHNDMRRME
ncbi:hypothetical protein C0Q70_12362 [Pomacea canaliculata]|uniref:Uncharacterized protein n=1 Tax=Pomacea canaliculata TaxID=400727 RepID=A0A2T7P1A3_POMCA|nr:hypothetical protein C0Q70_12362 [Pomacea canaliculata]